jgi:hypothetical protein
MFPGLKSSSDLLCDCKYKINVQMFFCWSFNASGNTVEGYREVEIRHVIIVF